MFKAFDTNGDGYVSMEEFDANLKPKTRRKLEACLEAGWKFDKEKWDATLYSTLRTPRYPPSKPHGSMWWHGLRK